MEEPPKNSNLSAVDLILQPFVGLVIVIFNLRSTVEGILSSSSTFLTQIAWQYIFSPSRLTKQSSGQFTYNPYCLYLGNPKIGVDLSPTTRKHTSLYWDPRADITLVVHKTALTDPSNPPVLNWQVEFPSQTSYKYASRASCTLL